MRITIIGAGVVGLVTSACFADSGHTVTCYDIDSKKIDDLAQGKLTVFEPGLKELIAKGLAVGRLAFTDDLAWALKNTEIVLLAVGTPGDEESGQPNLADLYTAVRAVASNLQTSAVIVTKSTVPVGTTRSLKNLLTQLRPDLALTVAANPEFLREGSGVKDFMEPDRVIIGTDENHGREVIAQLYAPIKARVIHTSLESAEMAKYAANSYLAMKLAFINEVSDLCERTGATIDEVCLGLGLDHRIGTSYLNVGPGYGGSCLPKDTAAFIHSARTHSRPLTIIEAVQASNTKRQQRMVGKIVDALGGDLSSKTIAVLGLTFKAQTNDLRSSTSLEIITTLAKLGGGIRVYDPCAQGGSLNVEIGASAYDVVTGADAVVILTEWPEFKDLDLNHLKSLMATPLLIDLRNLMDCEKVKSAGFNYVSLGRRDFWITSENRQPLV